MRNFLSLRNFLSGVWLVILGAGFDFFMTSRLGLPFHVKYGFSIALFTAGVISGPVGALVCTIVYLGIIVYELVKDASVPVYIWCGLPLLIGLGLAAVIGIISELSKKR